jgi:hypothetical protein
MQRAECRTSLRQRRYAPQEPTSVRQRRYALQGYPPYANGVTPPSPGLPHSGYPGITDQSNNSTLKGLRRLSSSAATPLGLMVFG